MYFQSLCVECEVQLTEMLNWKHNILKNLFLQQS